MCTTKQQVFVEEYLRCWNATKAARRAGYKHPNVQGSRLLTKVSVKAEIDARLSELKMDADEVMARLANQARGPEDDFIEIIAGQPFLDWERLAEAGKLGLIKRLSYDKDGRPVAEFYDSQKALELIGKHLGLFSDKLKIVGPDDGPLEMVNLTPDEALQRARMKAQEREQQLLNDSDNSGQGN